MRPKKDKFASLSKKGPVKGSEVKKKLQLSFLYGFYGGDKKIFIYFFFRFLYLRFLMVVHENWQNRSFADEFKTFLMKS
uniref:Uncharacterized protein n=1 Tax=Promethearchaeum syntrophicum TaxID=2594042 RepID=A0A5B9DD30_9ARCH|nr:hypothetical protein DSAG12_02970 [Candidatus Prometheoarchaeum syntrophicum]